MNKEIVESALSSLGRGFDLTSDLKLEYCKGKERLVLLNQAVKREITVPSFGSIIDVSIDIKCSQCDQTRYQSDILDFNQMTEFFNEKLSISSKIPSRSFNAMFNMQRGSWATDDARNFGVDGYFCVLFNIYIDQCPLVLSSEVRSAVPSSWDPCALSRFIEKYGTHIIVGLSIGGQDTVLVKQDKSSKLEPSELKKYLNDLGDQLFTRTSSLPQETGEQKYKGVSALFSRKGGDPSASSHSKWLQTVPSNPDAIHFNFIPITSLLKGVSGKALLSHAINLYLTCKPPTADLQHFLDFQVQKIWAPNPVQSDIPIGPTTNTSTPSPTLRFSFTGPKLYVNTIQVRVGKRPVTGMRLYLEGTKCNRLVIQLQHLSRTPTVLEDKIDDKQLWRGSEDIAANYIDMFYEPVHHRKFSHVCTAPVKYDPEWRTVTDASFIVTGAQLQVQKHESKSVLHLRLSFSKVNDSSIAQSSWVQGYIDFSQRRGFLTGLSTSITCDPDPIFEEKKPDEVVGSTGEKQKLLKFVDTSELCRGPMDNPGHWLITGARLNLEQGKIGLQVKFSLLNICS